MAESSSQTVLLTDDDKHFRTLMATALRAEGYTVCEAATPGQADEALKVHNPDLVVIDGDLGPFLGIDWIARQRAAGDVRHMVFVSAQWRDVTSFARLTNELGVARVMYKPISATEFTARVGGILRPQADQPRPASDDVFAVQMEALRAEYLTYLSARLEELDALRERSAAGDAAATSRAQSIAHQLKGTAGAYGCPALGQTAGLLEAALDRHALHSEYSEELLFELKETAEAETARWRVADSTAPPTEASGAQRERRSRILVVDDDPALLGQLEALTRRHLIDMIPATTTTDALAALRQQRVDLVVLNSFFQGQPSYELARQLRALPGCALLPLAFMSSKMDVAHRVEAAHAGAMMFISKPIEEQQFIATVQTIIKTNELSAPRVLLVDDDPMFARACTSILRHQGMNVLATGDPAHVLDSLTSFRPDLMLLDLDMPTVSGLDVCRAVRVSPEWQTLPILFLTGHSDAGHRLATFQAGGDDYLTKPVLPEELVARVKVRVDRIRLVKDRADRDPLSGLLLRRAFVEGLGQRLSEARRHAGRVSIALLDLDGFKQINDTRGHLVGDQVIGGLGEFLARRLRHYDLRGRWGGEEFVVALPGEGLATTSAVMESVLKEFSGQRFIGEAGRDFHVTFTAGIACFPEDGDTIRELIAAADRRLYAGKQAGRNRVVTRDVA